MNLVMPTRVLIVGAGGREHAIAWKLAAEPGVNEVVVAPGSAAIAHEDRVRAETSVDMLEPASIVDLARRMAAELVVIGPEGALAAGVADAVQAAGIPVFGPDAAAARLETSKAYCHDVAADAGVPMARARTFGGSDALPAAEYARELAASDAGIVLKADGLAGGKGVIVTETLEQALELIPSFLVGRPADAPALVIEECLIGREASVIAVCDGTRAVALPAARDHKRLCDGDTGPNTGGMGAYSPLPDLDDAMLETVLATVHRPILAEMARRGTPFHGFLYAGLMLTRTGPLLLECNVRLGDPEAQVILPRLAAPLGPLLLAAAEGRLPEAMEPLLPVIPGASVGIVLAAKGYPGTPKRGNPITGLEQARDLSALVFHAGTAERPGGGYGSNGGRVLTVVGQGPTLEAARAIAERAAEAIAWEGMQRRRDIAADLPVPAGVAR